MTDDAAPPTPEAGAEPRTARGGRAAPVCPTDDIPMAFESGRQLHDLWSEHYVCARCGRETFRSYGRGSV